MDKLVQILGGLVALGIIIAIIYILVAKPNLPGILKSADKALSTILDANISSLNTITKATKNIHPVGVALELAAGNKIPRPAIKGKCPEEYIFDGLTCRRPRSEYKNNITNASCPQDFKNIGLLCDRPAHSYKNTNVKSLACDNLFAATSLGTCFRTARTRDAVASGDAPGCHYGDMPFAKTFLGTCYNAQRVITRPLVCPKGQHIYLGKCYKACDPGFTLTGVNTCHTPAATRQPNVPSGWKVRGSKMFAPCKPGYERDLFDGCYRGPKTLGEDKMTCPAGSKKISGKCHPACKSNFERTVFGDCLRPIKVLGVDKIECAPGREKIGGLCYTDCPSGTKKDVTGLMCDKLSETELAAQK